MKLRHAVLGGVLAVALVAAGSAWWVFERRDYLVKSAIERFGPQLTGVSVKVREVELEPLDGRGTIRGLEMGNPPGYKTPRALTLGQMRLAIDFSTVRSNVVRIREVAIDAPLITYERGPGGDNLAVIQKHIDREVARLAGPSSGPERKYIIDRLQVRGARANYGGTATVPVPDLTMRDIGKRTNGATAAEVTRSVMSAMTSQATSVASRAYDKSVNTVRGLFGGK